MSESKRLSEIKERLSKIPEGPWFVGFDDADDCGPHKQSGLAMVDTGRSQDWPIVRLCEWPTAKFIAHSRDDIEYLLKRLETSQ